MSEMIYNPDEQIALLNERIAQVAADYTRSRIKRSAWLHAGDIHRAGELTRRLRMLNSELAFLASQRRQWDSVARH